MCPADCCLFPTSGMCQTAVLPLDDSHGKHNGMCGQLAVVCMILALALMLCIGCLLSHATEQHHVRVAV
jgi:hypothetical protein